MKKPTIFVVKCFDAYTPDNERTGSEAMFNHLVNTSERPLSGLAELKFLAKLHGWEVSVRPIRNDELDGD